MRIAFRTDASVNIGTGHLSRCLTLANSLRLQNWQTRFVCRDLVPAFAEQILAQDHELKVLQTTPATEPNTDGLAHSPWLAVPQEVDAAETMAALGPERWDWMVVDHYALDRRWETPLRGVAAGIFVIDDLADRIHDCDMLLDQNLTDARTDRYAGLTPAGCVKLIGVLYALLRPEFANAKRPDRKQGSSPRLNVLFGGTDPQGGTELALRAIGLLDASIAADVIVGGGNPHLATIRELCGDLPEVQLHIQASDIAKLFTAADLAIGAGGATSWERCRLGLPALITSMAHNQRRACEALAEARVAIDLGEMDRLTPHTLAGLIGRILTRPRLLAAMSRRAATLVDGLGTQRVVQHIINRHVI
jgi:UDP-2,4-diacetamido-2,4,6-trideoxy-beta-L-altropyranose hydrolase